MFTPRRALLSWLFVCLDIPVFCKNSSHIRPRGRDRGQLLTTTDALTQLATRQRFSEFLDQEWDRAILDGTPVALLIFDVDSLQRLNDARGLEAGDDCLRRIAAVIAGRVRRVSDISARYGGDEFAVMLACAEEPGALSVARVDPRRDREAADSARRVERQRLRHGERRRRRAHASRRLGVGALVVGARRRSAAQRNWGETPSSPAQLQLRLRRARMPAGRSHGSSEVCAPRLQLHRPRKRRVRQVLQRALQGSEANHRAPLRVPPSGL